MEAMQSRIAHTPRRNIMARTNHYEASIRAQQTKLARQRAAVTATEELIAGLEALQKAENEEQQKSAQPTPKK